MQNYTKSQLRKIFVKSEDYARMQEVADEFKNGEATIKDFQVSDILEVTNKTVPMPDKAEWTHNIAIPFLAGEYKGNYYYNQYTTPIINHILKDTGYRVALDEDWTKLTEAIGDEAGRKLKAIEYGGTDDYGFSVLLVGYMYSGSVYNYGTNAYYWSSSSYSADNAWRRFLYSGNAGVNRYYSNRYYLFSVSCKKDDNLAIRQFDDLNGEKEKAFANWIFRGIVPEEKIDDLWSEYKGSQNT